jgi:hypothetical protein
VDSRNRNEEFGIAKSTYRIDLHLIQTKKRRSTTATREEAKTQKRATQEPAGKETNSLSGVSEEITADHEEGEMVKDTKQNTSCQGGYLEFRKQPGPNKLMQKAPNQRQDRVQKDVRMQLRVYCCICKKLTLPGKGCNLCDHDRCPECLAKDIIY